MGEPRGPGPARAMESLSSQEVSDDLHLPGQSYETLPAPAPRPSQPACPHPGQAASLVCASPGSKWGWVRREEENGLCTGGRGTDLFVLSPPVSPSLFSTPFSQPPHFPVPRRREAPRRGAARRGEQVLGGGQAAAGGRPASGPVPWFPCASGLPPPELWAW